MESVILPALAIIALVTVYFIGGLSFGFILAGQYRICIKAHTKHLPWSAFLGLGWLTFLAGAGILLAQMKLRQEILLSGISVGVVLLLLGLTAWWVAAIISWITRNDRLNPIQIAIPSQPDDTWPPTPKTGA